LYVAEHDTNTKYVIETGIVCSTVRD